MNDVEEYERWRVGVPHGPMGGFVDVCVHKWSDPGFGTGACPK